MIFGILRDRSSKKFFINVHYRNHGSASQICSFSPKLTIDVPCKLPISRDLSQCVGHGSLTKRDFASKDHPAGSRILSLIIIQALNINETEKGNTYQNCFKNNPSLFQNFACSQQVPQSMDLQNFSFFYITICFLKFLVHVGVTETFCQNVKKETNFPFKKQLFTNFSGYL